MKSKRNRIIIFKGLLLIFYLTATVACQATLKTHNKKTVPLNKRILLKDGGPHKEVWEAANVVFYFNYTRENKQLFISGEMGLKDVKKLDYFFLWIHLLDPDGKILESKRYLSLSFRKAFWESKYVTELAPNTAAFAFSYKGRHRESGGDGSTVIDFYHSPF